MARCEVYYNLHKKCFSVRSLEPEDYGKVVFHTEEIVLDNAKFVVRKAGREKVLEEKKKNVHAFVRGDFVDAAATRGPISKHYNAHVSTRGLATYNPYKYETFVDKVTQEPVYNSSRVVMINRDSPVIFYEKEHNYA